MYLKLFRVHFTEIEYNFTLKKITFCPSLNGVKSTLVAELLELKYISYFYSFQCLYLKVQCV